MRDIVAEGTFRASETVGGPLSVGDPEPGHGTAARRRHLDVVAWNCHGSDRPVGSAPEVHPATPARKSVAELVQINVNRLCVDGVQLLVGR